MITSASLPERGLEPRLLARNLPTEHGFVPLRVDGRVPDDLRGTLLRNGPGVFELFGKTIAHSFSADGAITAIRFGDGTPTGACRVTDSAGRIAERAAGKPLYGDTVSWLRRMRNGLRGVRKNTANTSVMTWQGRVLALMEAGRPTELAIDAGDIRTIGETDLGVVGPAFSAHPHRVAARGAVYNFGVRHGRKPAIELYELPDVGPARRLGEIALGFNPMLHDFIATEHHLVFFLSPAALSVPRMLLQVGDFASMWRWQPERGTEVIAVPIDDPAAVVRFGVEPFYQWHFANAWSPSRTEIVVDYVRYRDFSSFGALARGTDVIDEGLRGRLHRARVDLTAKTLASEARWDRDCEFPRVHPTREGAHHDVTWLAGDDLRTIVRIDDAGRVEVADLGAGATVSEPIFVPRAGGGEADGWLLTLVHDGGEDRSYVAVLDGQRLGDGPVARAWLDHFVPMTFHGTWIP